MASRLPTGIQDFEKLRDLGLVYVDKTAAAWHLAQSGSPIFLSRPRRFGKSLLVSVLKYYWQGRRDLFEGYDFCALEDETSEPWVEHAVLHLDLGNDNYALEGNLEKMLNNWLAEREAIYGCVGDGDEKLAFAGRFLRLIKSAGRQSGVVSSLSWTSTTSRSWTRLTMTLS